MTYGNPEYDAELYLNMMHYKAPKVVQLLDHIALLDAEDMKTHKQHFKHFIYTNRGGKYGVSLIAGGLVAKGYAPAFDSSISRVLNVSNSFGIVTDKKMFDKSPKPKFIKRTLEVYNERPSQDHMRIIVIDSGFREGIDLLDVKYVHIFEKIANEADEKQAIARATRFCGQKGLTFNPKAGWPLKVFEYDFIVHDGPEDKFSLPDFVKAQTVNAKLDNFKAAMSNLVIEGSVDFELNRNIHEFKTGGALPKKFDKYKYPKAKLKNMCDGPELAAGPVKLTKTQDFMRNYFTPKSEQKGMLLWSSMGAGKTCTALATISSSFEKSGYTILWVTKHTLKSDIWKNIYKQVCHMSFVDKSVDELKELSKRPFANLPQGWMPPMSYRQFSNMLLQKSKLYDKLISKNGTTDPLHKTLIIIDEAHKLYDTGALKSAEQPNMEVLTQMINSSYETSKKDSARILVMTGTPFTEDPMSFVKTMNLMLQPQQKLPDIFDAFSEKFLNIDGLFSASGKQQFTKRLDGLVSYLDRSKDARYFAIPEKSTLQTNAPIISDTLRSKDFIVKEQLRQLKQTNKAVKDYVKDMNRFAKSEIRDVKSCKNDAACLAGVDAFFKKARAALLEHMQIDPNFRDLVDSGHSMDVARSEKAILEATLSQQRLKEEIKALTSARSKLTEMVATEMSKEKKKRDMAKIRNLRLRIEQIRIAIGWPGRPVFNYSSSIHTKCLLKNVQNKSHGSDEDDPQSDNDANDGANKKEKKTKDDLKKSASKDANVLKMLRENYIEMFDSKNKPELKKREILITFHPDKLPIHVKEILVNNTQANTFASRLFHKIRQIDGLKKSTLVQALNDPGMIGGKKPSKSNKQLIE
jgi:hypothetical protein